MILISIGSASKILEQFPTSLRKIMIENEREAKGGQIVIPEQFSSEKYEQEYQEIVELNDLKNQNVLFVMLGGSTISGICLRLLEQIKNNGNNINILYVEPDRKTLCNLDKLHENVTFHVLQEYAWSKLFERDYLISNTVLLQLNKHKPYILFSIFSNIVVSDSRICFGIR